MKVKARVSALRGLMKKARLHAYIVPSTDPHQSEYVPALWRRREWISGFTGSAGDAVVTLRSAALWTDGRYFLQAEAQLAGSGIRLMKIGQPKTPTIAAWLGKELPKGGRVGVDPRLLSIAQYRKLRGDLKELNIELLGIERNLIDVLWSDRPAAPTDPLIPHGVEYSGERFRDKLKRVRNAMAAARAQAHVIGALDCVAWLFNIRGTDVLHNPVVIAYAIVTSKDATLFVEGKKVPPEVRRAFGRHVRIRSYDKFRDALIALGRRPITVWADPNSTSFWIADLLTRRAKLLLRESPVVLMKSAKNAREVAGMRRAHVRDGVAMVRFLHWLDGAVGREKVTEVSAAEKLEKFRARSSLFRGVSFDSIIGYAAHGAVIHYSATPQTDVPIRKRGLLIVDSGGQYPDGTTDITRTICLGTPTPEQKRAYTRVLKGHIAVATASYPAGTAGRQIDTLARKALWDAGLDYNHGTGHGVGAYLSVHEGPQSISPTRDTGVPLAPGMICSNEPGYYKAGEYGIRVENLVCVVKDKLRSTPERTFLTFENLTLCPIETRLVDARWLTAQEIHYLNGYHALVFKSLSPHLNQEETAWLRRATRPIR